MLMISGGKNPGHPCREKHIRNLCSLLVGIQTDCADLNALTLEKLLQYQNILIFTSLEGAKAAVLADIGKFSECGGKFLFFFHEAAIYDRQNTVFGQLFGVRFKTHEPYGKFRVFAENHPLTKGLDNYFWTQDELYFFDQPLLLNAQDKVFLKSEDNSPVGYERVLESGSGLIYISLGHDDKSVDNEGFKKIIGNIGLFISN